MADKLFSFQIDSCNSYENDESSPSLSGDSDSGTTDSGNNVDETYGMGVNGCKPNKNAILVSNVVTLRSMAKAGRNFMGVFALHRRIPHGILSW